MRASYFRSIPAGAVTLALAACGSAPLENLDPPTIVVTVPAYTLVAGATMQATATVVDANGNASRRTVTWRSGNPALAEVSGTGLIVARGPGLVSIFAELGGTSTERDLIVIPAPLPSTPTTSFFSYTSAADHPIGQGRSERFNIGDGTWAASPAFGIQTVEVRSGGIAGWRLLLGGTTPGPLAIGRYENASASPGPGQPLLMLFAESRHCSGSVGDFTIHDIAIGYGQTVHRLHATFTHRCPNHTGTLTGEVAVLQYPWR